jgi:hypothetical protein
MSARVLALLLVVSGILAGCATTPETPVSTTAPAAPSLTGVGLTGVYHLADGKAAPPVNASFPMAIGGEYLLPQSASEPSIGADKAGNVFMTGSNVPIGAGPAMRKTPTIYATFDHGATIKNVGPNLAEGVSQHANTNDPIVHVDYDTGRVFMDDILPLSCGVLSWSDDKGAMWTTNPYSCGNSNLNDHQTIGTAKARKVPMTIYPNVVYRCVNNGAASECAMSYNGGLSFTPQVPVFVNAVDGCGGLTSHLRSGPDGTMYLPKADCPGGPKVKYTEDDGISWQTIQIPFEKRAGDHEMGFAVDKTGHFYATFEVAGQVFFTASPDKGKTWLTPRNVTAPGVTGTMFNTMAMGDDGKVAFAYLGTTIPGGYEGKGQGNAGLSGDVLGQPTLPEWDNATWNGYIGVIVDALDPNATIQTVTANDPTDPLARGLCGGTRCHGMNDFIEIAIDGQGRPWASFVDTCTQKCVTDPTVKSDKVLGMFATLRAGPALRGDAVALDEIPAQAVAKKESGAPETLLAAPRVG